MVLTEWRYPYPLLEEAGLETWAVDILGWGFSDLERLPPCNVKSKREHFYQLWKSHIKRPMILVGPSLGAAVAIDFVANHPKAVEKLVLIDASVYAEGTGNLATLPKIAAYAGVKQKTCIIWGEDDQIISNKLAVKLHCELPNATIRQIPDCGHLPHVERPNSVAKLIVDFVHEDCYKEAECVSQY
nr:putative hydrolase yugf [Quercus suber]